ncbi:MAG TPA: radical SAM protein [Flexilinea sp.]|nr:radical SAM protein [Flexilinea sp.]
MKSILRKSILYKSGISSLDYAMNPVLGCAHGCRYPCYAWLMAMRFGKVKSYSQWIQPAIVGNTLELLEEELRKWHWKIHHVQLCLTTDPFMVGYPEVRQLSLASIGMINQNGIPCGILTKGVLPPELAEMDQRNSYGISLVSLDEEFRERWEPGAAPYRERIDALRYLHNKGMHTWVHMEPYPTPNVISQDLNEILEEISFVDSIDFGRWNYSSLISHFPDSDAFYRAMEEQVRTFCEAHGIEY